eukprot:1129387-Prorocentrum_lima.AAC.1
MAEHAMRLCPKGFGGRSIVRAGQSHGVVQGVGKAAGDGAVGCGAGIRQDQAEQGPVSFGGPLQ